MELKLNEKLLFNVLLLLNNMHAHVMLSSNMKLSKSELFVNSNVLVLLKLIHKLTFNNMVLNFLMLATLLQQARAAGVVEDIVRP